MLEDSSKIEISPKDDLSISDMIKGTKPWYKVAHLRFLTWCIFLMTLSSTNSGYDMSIMNGLQSLSHWENKMGNPSGQRLGALSNGVAFGAVLSAVLGSYLADRWGRRTAVQIGALLTVLGSILQGLSTGYGFFLVSRIIIGFGATLANVGSPALISEVAYPSHREACTFAYNVCWYLGAIVASWVTYGTRNVNSDWSWRIPSYIQGFLPLLQLVFLWQLPESPRYMVKKGRIDEAEKILRKHHIGNLNEPQDVALVEFELSEIEAAIAADSVPSSYKDFVVIKSYRRRIFLVVFVGVMTQLSGNGLVSYYLVQVLESIGITSTKKQLQINGCLMIYNFAICCFMTSICTKIKRRTMFIGGVGGMLVSYIIWTVLSAINEQRNFDDKLLANGVLAMIFFYYFFYDTCLNGLPYLYLTEVLPYSHRAKGLMIMQASMYTAMIYNNYVNTIAMDAILWKYYIVYCCILAVEFLVVLFFFPETSGYTLEEVAQVFGDEVIDLAVAGAKHKVEHEHVESV